MIKRVRRVARDTSRSLTAKRLALRVVRHADREAGLVLGDHLLEQDRGTRYGKHHVQLPTRNVFRELPERYDDAILTGRKKNVRFVVSNPSESVQREWRTSSREAERAFFVQAHEVIYNLARYASLASKAPRSSANDVFAVWTVTHFDLLRAMKRLRILPRSIRDIAWLQGGRTRRGVLNDEGYTLRYGGRGGFHLLDLQPEDEMTVHWVYR